MTEKRDTPPAETPRQFKPLCVFEKNGVVCGFAADFISHSLHEGGYCDSMDCHKFTPPKELLCAATLGDGTKCSRPVEEHMNPKQFVPDSEPAETKAGPPEFYLVGKLKCQVCGLQFAQEAALNEHVHRRGHKLDAEPAAPVSPPQDERVPLTPHDEVILNRFRAVIYSVRPLCGQEVGAPLRWMANAAIKVLQEVLMTSTDDIIDQTMQYLGYPPVEREAQTPPEELAKGTFRCDICGQDTPHFHDPELVEIERLVRPAFEKTKVPRNSFGRISKNLNIPYSDPLTEQLWQHFVSGWFAHRRLLREVG